MPSKFRLSHLAGASLAVLATPALAMAAESPLLDVIVVTGARPDTSTELSITPEAAPLQGGDITHLTARTPGGARIGNGELSGQMQYRGLFGQRLNLRVDGQRFASGGPNLMDPVFHYAPGALVAAITIDRGVSPVSAGPGLAGGADAVFKRIGYGQGDDSALGYDLTISGRSVNQSLAAGGVIGASTDSWRFNLLGAWEEADDTDYGDGVIGGTSFERGVFGVSAGLRTDLGEVTLDARRQNTGPSGNPPFPMDILYFDTDFARLAYGTDIGQVRLQARLTYADVAHLMDNLSLRPAPSPAMQRASYAEATTRGGELSLGFDAFGGTLEIGMDGEQIDHAVAITNPNTAGFFVSAYPEVEMARIGGFAEWRGAAGWVNAELGLRIDQNAYDAGEAMVGPALAMGPRNLAATFNRLDRSGDEVTVDAAARLWTPAEAGLSWRVTLAHKQQMPGYIQRFGWLPINASGGLADGNIYVGDLHLAPETAWIGEVGFDYASRKAYLRPTLYLRQVNDYIQGVPYDATPGVADTPVEMVAAMSGDPTPLRWDNVEARLYGFDLDAGYDFDGPLRLDGVLNYVRGQRRDIDDDLYRITAPNLTLGLTWEAEAWSATLESRVVARQDKVSATNSEPATDGYVVFSAHGQWEVRPGVRLAAGVENLLDEVYQDHLAGYNRNGFGEVPVGQRVPGPGRGAFLRLSIAR
jgi:iron complex outermembrane receptor protein